jgi:nucleoside phosphorylase
MIGVVFATEEEAQPFLQSYKRGRFDGLVEGEVQHDDTLLVSITGTGKIKATLRTERLLQRYDLNRLIHAGTCTALSDDFPVGSVFAANQVLEGDRIELAAPSYPRMPVAVPFDDLAEGTLVTQDHTAKEQKEYSYWQRIADVSDMTGYAVAYVTAMHGIPCHIVKVVAGQLQVQDEDIRKTKAAAYERMAQFLVEHLETLYEKE